MTRPPDAAHSHEARSREAQSREAQSREAQSREAQSREERLAAKLRENLRRRKAQARNTVTGGQSADAGALPPSATNEPGGRPLCKPAAPG